MEKQSETNCSQIDKCFGVNNEPVSHGQWSMLDGVKKKRFEAESANA